MTNLWSVAESPGSMAPDTLIKFALHRCHRAGLTRLPGGKCASSLGGATVAGAMGSQCRMVIAFEPDNELLDQQTEALANFTVKEKQLL